jgi:hypothetical protein
MQVICSGSSFWANPPFIHTYHNPSFDPSISYATLLSNILLFDPDFSTPTALGAQVDK